MNTPTVQRLCYAMFYKAEALLLPCGLAFSKHSGVQAAFGSHFAKSAELDPKYHRWLLEAFSACIAGDYGVGISLIPQRSRRRFYGQGHFWVPPAITWV